MLMGSQPRRTLKFNDVHRQKTPSVVQWDTQIIFLVFKRKIVIRQTLHLHFGVKVSDFILPFSIYLEVNADPGDETYFCGFWCSNVSLDKFHLLN